MIEIFKKLLVPDYVCHHHHAVSDYISLIEDKLRENGFCGEKETDKFWNQKWLLVLVQEGAWWNGFLFKRIKGSFVYIVAFDISNDGNEQDVIQVLRSVNDVARKT